MSERKSRGKKESPKGSRTAPPSRAIWRKRGKGEWVLDRAIGGIDVFLRANGRWEESYGPGGGGVIKRKKKGGKMRRF